MERLVRIGWSHPSTSFVGPHAVGRMLVKVFTSTPLLYPTPARVTQVRIPAATGSGDGTGRDMPERAPPIGRASRRGIGDAARRIRWRAPG